MEVLTGLGKTILSTENEKQLLDQSVKTILAYKPILARILKETAVECKDMSPDDIEVCIEGEVQISSIYVDSGLSNTEENNISEKIDGLNTEAYINDEGLARYDIRTYLRIPDSTGKKQIKLIINVESQNKDKPGYDISLRALFYCCRMISSQQDIEFTTNTDDPVKYGNIKKVYSIWICTSTAEARANSVEKYDLRREFLFGHNDDNPRYDILTAVIVNVGRNCDPKDTESALIRMLSVLFDKQITTTEKFNKLKNEHGLKLTKEIQEEVTTMCNYADAVEQEGINIGFKQGIEQGIEQGIKKSLAALVRSLKVYIKDFESLYSAVISNEEYKDVTRDEVKNCLIQDQS